MKRKLKCPGKYEQKFTRSVKSSIFYLSLVTIMLLNFSAEKLNAQSAVKLPEYVFPARPDEYRTASVAVYGNYACRAAIPNTNWYGNPIIGVIYKRTVHGEWKLHQKLSVNSIPNPAGTDEIICKVTMYGQWLMISPQRSGKVFLYRLDPVKDLWMPDITFSDDHPDKSTWFGGEIAIYGNHLTIGDVGCSKNNNGNNYYHCGAVFLSTFDGNGWSGLQKITKPLINNKHSYEYASKLSINGKYIFSAYRKKPLDGFVETGYYIDLIEIDQPQNKKEYFLNFYRSSWSIDMDNRFLAIGDYVYDNHNGKVDVFDLEKPVGTFFQRTSFVADDALSRGEFGKDVSIHSFNENGASYHYIFASSNSAYNHTGNIKVFKYDNASDSFDNERIITFQSNSGYRSYDGEFIDANTGNLIFSTRNNNEAAYVAEVSPKKVVNLTSDINAQPGTVNFSWDRGDNYYNDFKTYGYYVIGYNHDTLNNLEGTSNRNASIDILPGEVRSFGVSAYNNLGGSQVNWKVVKAHSGRSISGKVKTEQGGGVGNVRLLLTHKGNAAGLNGSDTSFLAMPYLKRFSDSSFTIETWIKLQSESSAVFSYAHPAPASDLALTINQNGCNVTLGQHTINGFGNGLPSDGSWNHLAITWENNTGNLKLYINGALAADTSGIGWGYDFDPDGTFVIGQLLKDPGNDFESGHALNGDVDEFRIWNRALSSDQIASDFDKVLSRNQSGLLYNWRFDEKNEDRTEVAYNQLQNEDLLFLHGISFTQGAKLFQKVISSTEPASIGEFHFDDLNFTDIDTFIVYADTTGGRSFDHDSLVIVLNESVKTVDDADFTDFSSVSFKGTITYKNTNCPAGDVFVYLKKPFDLLETTKDTVYTDQNGNFGLSPQLGEYYLYFSYKDHTYSLGDSMYFSITGPSDTVYAFEDITMHTISGKVVSGSCDLPFEPFDILIKDTKECGIDTIVSTVLVDGLQRFSVQLPAVSRDYTVSIVSSSLSDETRANINNKSAFLNFTKKANIDSGDSVINFYYRTRPEINFLTDALPLGTCDDIPVMEQGMDHTLKFQVTERYENADSVCPVSDQVTVTLFDEIGDEKKQVLKADSSDIFSYTVVAGKPNIIAGGLHPYQKKLEIGVEVEDGGSVSFNKWAYVTGFRPRNKTFTTVSPEIPLLILRDPPGDDSYSTLEQSTTTCFGTQMSIQDETYAGIDQTLMAGATFEVPVIGTDVEIIDDLNQSFEVGYRAITQNEHEFCITTTRNFSTDDNDAITGDEGDVYIGAALNLAYAITDVLSVKDCEPVLSKTIMYGLDAYNKEPFKTTYVYSGKYIKDYLIPELEKLITFQNSPDSVDYYKNQINVWKQVIKRNEDLKANADKLEFYDGSSNISFGGSEGAVSASRTASISQSWSVGFDMYINQEVAREVGLDIDGAGFKLGAKVGVNFETGSMFTGSSNNTRTVGFELNDNDIGDVFSVDLKVDPVYATPVFDLVSGKSKCPAELGTLPSWLKISKAAFSVSADTIVDKAMEFKPEGLQPGRYTDTVYVESSAGKDKILVNLTLVNDPPVEIPSVINGNDSMAVVADVVVDNINIAGENDQLIAFINDKVAGAAEFEKTVPFDSYYNFLTIKGNENDVVHFKFWDSSSDSLYFISDSLILASDTAIGYISPDSLNVLSLEPVGIDVDRIVLDEGWNWITFQVENNRTDVNEVLNNVAFIDGAVIKDQVNYAQYSSKEGWKGSLKRIETGKPYKVYTNQPAYLVKIGKKLSEEAQHKVMLQKGWNWIPANVTNFIKISNAIYLPGHDNVLLVSETDSVTITDGNQYDGGLNEMSSNAAYMVYVEKKDTLAYPGAKGMVFGVPDKISRFGLPKNWEIGPAQYANSMTLTSQLFYEGSKSIDTNKVIGAFVDKQCVGLSVPVKYKNGLLNFINIYGNRNDVVRFKLYDLKKETVEDIIDSIVFVPDSIVGNAMLPYKLNTVIKSFKIINSAPIDIEISNHVITKDAGKGDVIAVLSAIDPNPADNHTYVLVDGDSSDDNAVFTIEGQLLKLHKDPGDVDELKLRVMATDDEGLSYEKAFVLKVISTSQIEQLPIKKQFEVSQNYPNPFDDHAVIEYNLHKPGDLRFDLYNFNGVLVKSRIYKGQPVGKSQIVLQADTLPSGVYFYNISFNGQSIIKKMVVY